MIDISIMLLPNKEKATEGLLIAIENKDIDFVNLDNCPTFYLLRDSFEFQELKTKVLILLVRILRRIRIRFL